MVSFSAHFDGKVIVPDEPTSIAPGTRLRVTVEQVERTIATPGEPLNLPLLKGVDPDTVRMIVEDSEFDIENAKSNRLRSSDQPDPDPPND